MWPFSKLNNFPVNSEVIYPKKAFFVYFPPVKMRPQFLELGVEMMKLRWNNRSLSMCIGSDISFTTSVLVIRWHNAFRTSRVRTCHPNGYGSGKYFPLKLGGCLMFLCSNFAVGTLHNSLVRPSKYGSAWLVHLKQGNHYEIHAIANVAFSLGERSFHFCQINLKGFVSGVYHFFQQHLGDWRFDCLVGQYNKLNEYLSLSHPQAGGTAHMEPPLTSFHVNCRKKNIQRDPKGKFVRSNYEQCIHTCSCIL